MITFREIEPQSSFSDAPHHAGMQAESTNPEPGLLRLSAAARAAGLTSRVMARGLETREIPLAVVEVGALKFIRAAELNQWLRNPQPQMEDLFK